MLRTNLTDKKLSAEFNLSVLFLSLSDRAALQLLICVCTCVSVCAMACAMAACSAARVIGAPVKPRSHSVISRELWMPGGKKILFKPFLGLRKCVNVCVLPQRVLMHVGLWRFMCPFGRPLR